MATVKDVIKGRKFFTVQNDTPVKKISKVLTDMKVSNIPVVDKKGYLLGVVSEKDIIKCFSKSDFLSLKAEDIMTTKIIHVKDSDALEKVAKIFSEKNLRKLPVIKRKKVIGIITRDDIISRFMKYY
ncbi:MAG: CBS domain-containing protein [Candidatus Kappaea frigidicola]|nr:CBS domain-containing protein [Candidatus Kappaea frigidicola]